MTLQNLYFFTEIVKDMNLGITAERMFTSQQALSGHIKRLESHFGVKLFERKPKLILTSEGHALLREAKVILDAESRLFIEYGTGVQKDHGNLRIACGLGRSKYYLTSALSDFSSRYPAVVITCVDENKYRTTPMFESGEVDIAVGRRLSSAPYVRHMKMFSTRCMVVLTRSLLEKHIAGDVDAFISRAEKGVELTDLPHTIPVVHTGMHAQEHWLCERVPEIRDFPRVYITPQNHDMLFDLCRDNRAMILITDLYCRYFREYYSAERQGDLVYFPLKVNGEFVDTDEEIYYNAEIAHPQFFFDFIQVLQENIREKHLCD